MPDNELTDSGGRVKHPADCPCKVCKGVRTAGERRQREAEESATVRAVARALVKLMARGSLSGPDALRNLAGPGDALRILRMAGMSPEQTAAGWQADAPAPGPAEHKSSPWASSPDHDERVIAALLRGAGDGELARIRAEVAAEYRQRAARQAARQQSSVMWRTRDGDAVMDGGTAPLGVSLGPDGAPVQVSRVDESVPPLGAERA